LVQYQYGHIPLQVLASRHGARTGTGIFERWFSTGIDTVHSRYWHSVVPIPVMANMYLESVPVWAHSINRTGIKLCPYQYWHFCTFVQYQYWHSPLPVLALNGVSTGISIFAVLSNTSIDTVHHQYCHYLVPILVLAFWHFCPIPVLARYIIGTGIKWCQYRNWHI
jgi:hypothetical protein